MTDTKEDTTPPELTPEARRLLMLGLWSATLEGLKDRLEGDDAANLAEAKARMLAHAAREGWGDVEGLPTMSGDCLIFHFTSGRRGIVRLPQNSNYGKEI